MTKPAPATRPSRRITRSTAHLSELSSPPPAKKSCLLPAPSSPPSAAPTGPTLLEVLDTYPVLSTEPNPHLADIYPRPEDFSVLPPSFRLLKGIPDVEKEVGELFDPEMIWGKERRGFAGLPGRVLKDLPRRDKEDDPLAYYRGKKAPLKLKKKKPR